MVHLPVEIVMRRGSAANSSPSRWD